MAIGIAMVSCTSEGAEVADTPDLNPEQEKVEALKAEVMQLHDKTMAQKSQLGQLTNQLKAAAKEAADTAALYNAYTDLTHAGEDMMSWMHNFKSPDDMDVAEAEKIKYLESQKAKMAEISEYTDRSIDKANEILSSL